MRRVVHVNGYSLAQNPELTGVVSRNGEPRKGGFGDWHHVCYGNEHTGELGRIPMALWLAHEIQADRIVWSTGSTRTAAGEWEAEYLFNYALGLFTNLRRDFPHRFTDGFFKYEAQFRVWLRKISMFDIESTNTSSSMIALEKMLRQAFGIAPLMAYSVTSANHLPRTCKEHMIGFDFGTGIHTYQRLFTPAYVPAETNYAGKTVPDVLIAELGDVDALLKHKKAREQ